MIKCTKQNQEHYGERNEATCSFIRSGSQATCSFIRSGSQATYAGAYIKLGIMRRSVLARLSHLMKRSVPTRLSHLKKSYQRTEEPRHKIKKNQRIAPPPPPILTNEVKEWAATKKALTLRAESSMISASNFCDCGRS